ncbi:glycosyltransferase [Vibrio plantisponsor]|uniref:Glycosyltransferase n=1 Tax=Vibrio plantisponsor TaxID=664643 RepID=A0ABU4IIS8_9VIBR|nr:glycosyltransferase [Vibrio plantisponsor]MDW6018295.1 glycosyltransferase [Vibrio plantisponsor]NNM42479.1 glycosyltransferase [Vibrio plantisponsor]
MKILHVYRTCYPETKGGVEQVIRYICQGMDNLGAQSKVLSVSSNKQHKELYVGSSEILLCAKDFEIASNSFSFKLFPKFRQLAQWADIIHYHYPWPTGDLLALFDNNKPTIVTYHSDIIKQKTLKLLYRPLEQYFLSKVDLIVATSPQYAQSSPNLTKYKNKTHIVPLAVNPDDYRKQDYSWNPDENLSHVGSDYFLFLGVLRYYKGLNYLLEAAKSTNLKVVIAGKGPLEAELKKRIKKEKIHNIKMLGYVSEQDKLKLLYHCKAFVFPSHVRSEAFGVSLIEAQMFSKPIISCDIGTGTSHVNVHNETGVVVQAANTISLREAMMKLASEPDLCKKYGRMGYQRAMNNFTINHQADEYNRLYKKLITNKS